MALSSAKGSPVEGGERLSFVRANGAYFANEQTERLSLRGVNLGNWFLLEAWMMGIGDVPDQHSIYQILDRRFGVAKRKALIERHRATWITGEDFAQIRDLGMNCVRLPVHYSVLVDLKEPEFMCPNGFQWMDRVLQMAKDSGLYVILDLHGVPGGQSVEQPSGRVGSNGLWGSDVNKDLTVLIWEGIAKRYQGEATIAAYDIINEPYADSPRAPIREELRLLCERIYRSIRAQGDNHVILFPATQMGFFFYRTPEEMGATNLGFTEHFYPGIFHGEQTVAGHAEFISHELYPRHELLQEWAAPYLVGEFNVVHEHTGGDRMMQKYWQLYDSLGWGATMWSYKLIKASPGVEPSNWYLGTNEKRIVIPDLRTASYEELEAFFDHSDLTLTYDPDAVAAFKGELRPKYDLPRLPVPRNSAPPPQLAPGWKLAEVGTVTLSGSANFSSDGSVNLFGTGDDIFEDHDGFTYVYRDLSGDFVFEAELSGMEATRRFAKSGLMVRESLEPTAAMALLNVFPDGGVAFAMRPAAGAETVERKAQTDGFPIRLRLESKDGKVRGSWKSEGGDWNLLGNRILRTEVLGFATVSNHLNQVATASISEFTIQTNKGNTNE